MAQLHDRGPDGITSASRPDSARCPWIRHRAATSRPAATSSPSASRDARPHPDHPGCPAQLTDEKDRAQKRLALAAEGYCVQSGWRHRAAHADGA
ncbi:DUF6420 family protein [Streptomyces longwoodensis]